jgi:hypothetical protein
MIKLYNSKGIFIRGKVSNNYYFSSFGEIPLIVVSNNSENAIKSILETEFKIDRDAKFNKLWELITLRQVLRFHYGTFNV